MGTPWPGYTPPSSGSSQNDGTPPITAYNNIESAWTTQMGTLGYDVSQMPPQAYGNNTSQSVNSPERFTPPSQPTNVVLTTSGTSGTGKVTWVAGANLPSQGYKINVTDGTTQAVTTVTAGPSATTVNVPGLTVGHSDTAVVIAVGAITNVPSSASGAWTVT